MHENAYRLLSMTPDCFAKSGASIGCMRFPLHIASMCISTKGGMKLPSLQTLDAKQENPINIETAIMKEVEKYIDGKKIC